MCWFRFAICLYLPKLDHIFAPFVSICSSLPFWKINESEKRTLSSGLCSTVSGFPYMNTKWSDMSIHVDHRWPWAATWHISSPTSLLFPLFAQTSNFQRSELLPQSTLMFEEMVRSMGWCGCTWFCNIGSNNDRRGKDSHRVVDYWIFTMIS